SLLFKNRRPEAAATKPSRHLAGKPGDNRLPEISYGEATIELINAIKALTRHSDWNMMLKRLSSRCALSEANLGYSVGRIERVPFRGEAARKRYSNCSFPWKLEAKPFQGYKKYFIDIRGLCVYSSRIEQTIVRALNKV
ncbi:MAG: hypothetical protein ACRD1I_00680, partial [Terriglobia bacterium]